MIYAIIFLFLYCVYLHATKAANCYVPSGLYDNIKKLNILNKAHYKLLAEEYQQLKGYDGLTLYDDSVNFLKMQTYTIDNNGVEHKDLRSFEVIKYLELSEKVEQLKKDMKRGCEIFCKEEK